MAIAFFSELGELKDAADETFSTIPGDIKKPC
jgi:hypothetical protein